MDEADAAVKVVSSSHVVKNVKAAVKLKRLYINSGPKVVSIFQPATFIFFVQSHSSQQINFHELAAVYSEKALINPLHLHKKGRKIKD